jgi:type III secretion protein R
MFPNSLPDPIAIIVGLGLLALIPFIAVMVTSYAKIVIVTSLVRNALGIQQVPPNLVLNGLAVVLSLYVMAPVVNQITNAAQEHVKPGQTLSAKPVFEMLDSAREPLRQFLSKHANPMEKQFFLKSAEKIWPEALAKDLKDNDLLVLIPAFTVTELTAAFKIGFIIYLAFVIIDLVIANILVAMGMMMFSPTVVSVPLKLLLFVSLDGWAKLIHGLILTYR